MKSRIFMMGVMLTALMVVTGVAQDEDQVVMVQDFETFDAQITGGAVTFAFAEQYANAGVPAPENGGEWGLLAAYDNTGGGTWGQSTITFADPVDLTGMTELHLSIFFTEDSVPNRNGDEIHVRFHWNNQDEIGFPWIKIGEWNDLVFPIDPYASENEIAAFDKLRLIPSAGNEGTGSFMIDNVYAVRPANTPELEIVPVYGFNETNPGEDTPKGWMNHDGLAPILGADYAEPSEGSNCMLLPVDGNNIRTAKTINTKADVDWTRVRAVYFDVRVTDDWEGWGNLRYFIESSSGGTYLHSQRRDIDSVKDSWRTVSFWVDLGSHMDAILGDGDFSFGLLHHNGSPSRTPDGQHILIDNFRVGMISSFCLVTRELVDDPIVFEGDSTSLPINLNMTMKGEAGTVEVKETLPAGWTATDISDQGQLSDGVITWNVEVSPDEQKTVSYTAVSPDSIENAPTWSGTVDGEEVFGDDSVFYLSQYAKNAMVEAPQLANTVELDGVISSGEYENANVYEFGHDTSDGNTPPGVHLSGNEYPFEEENMTFHVFHDQEYIYVAMDVVDPDLSFEYPDMQFWHADSTELYFNGNMTQLTQRETNHFGCQLTVVGDGSLAASNNKYFPEMLDAPSGGKYMLDGRDSEDGPIYWGCGAKVKDDQSGFIVEYRVKKDVIAEPVGRTMLGFEIMMNSSEAASEAQRTGKWGWHSSNAEGEASEMHVNETGWTVIKLLQDDVSVSDWSLF